MRFRYVSSLDLIECDFSPDIVFDSHAGVKRSLSIAGHAAQVLWASLRTGTTSDEDGFENAL